MSLLCFILCFTMTMTNPIIEELRTPEKVVSEVKTMEEMDYDEIVAAEEEEETTSAHYYGNCRITFYCPGPCCCGQWAGGGTASGTVATANRTVANGSLPFGTRVLIGGVEYIVEDRGVGGDQFDIFVNSHQEALDRGLYYTDVYIIDG